MTGTPTSDELAEALDVVWGLLPTAQVKELEADDPRVYDLCQRNHEQLWHMRGEER